MRKVNPSQPNEPAYMRRSAAALPESLSNDERINVGIATPDGSATLVVDNAFIIEALSLIKRAKSEIRICAYAWRWYPNEPEIGIQKLNVALLQAQRRGVKIRCLVDTEAQRIAFTTLGFNCRSVVNTRMLHTKAISTDSGYALIGSHNLTKRATTDNYEMSVLVREFQVVDSFNTYFDKMWMSRG